MENRILRSGPVVCAAGSNYQIMIPLRKKALIKIKVGSTFYYDHCNGIRRSDAKVQRFTIPMEALDQVKEYTVYYEEVIKRMPYECLKGETGELTYSFRPVNPSGDFRIYYISDCHGMLKEPVCAAEYFGDKLDVLILNGDISSSCATFTEAMLPYDIAYKVTGGELPCIITRGNHDLRGKLSEQLTDLMPSVAGNAYYMTKLGKLNFLVLDCGEDKNDDHKEYSGTAAFHTMRMEETEFIKRELDGFDPADKFRIVLSHIPFYHRNREQCKGEAPFDIEDEIYTEWTNLINAKYAPQLVLAGHMHTNGFFTDDPEVNYRKISGDVIVSGQPLSKEKNYIGAAITLSDSGNKIVFTDKDHKHIKEITL